MIFGKTYIAITREGLHPERERENQGKGRNFNLVVLNSKTVTNFTEKLTANEINLVPTVFPGNEVVTKSRRDPGVF